MVGGSTVREAKDAGGQQRPPSVTIPRQCSLEYSTTGATSEDTSDEDGGSHSSRNKRLLKSLVLLFLLTLISAGVLTVAELDHEIKVAEEKQQVHIKAREIMRNLANITAVNKTELGFLEELLKSNKMWPTKVHTYNWKFSGAFFFTSTVITTIGFGNFAPLTAFGRGYTVFLCIFGIGYFAFVLTLTGERVLAFLVRAFERVKGHGFKMSSLNQFRLVSWACIAFLAFCSLLGLLVDDWTLFDSFYFSVLTLTTVGLGDLVPSVDASQGYVSVALIYCGQSLLCLTGLALLSGFLTGLERHVSSLTILPLRLGSALGSGQDGRLSSLEMYQPRKDKPRSPPPQSPPPPGTLGRKLWQSLKKEKNESGAVVNT